MTTPQAGRAGLAVLCLGFVACCHRVRHCGRPRFVLSTDTLPRMSPVPRCLQEKLNVAAIDAVSAALRLALVEEREALTEDVEYLQALLQDEADRQVGADEL